MYWSTSGGASFEPSAREWSRARACGAEVSRIACSRRCARGPNERQARQTRRRRPRTPRRGRAGVPAPPGPASPRRAPPRPCAPAPGNNPHHTTTTTNTNKQCLHHASATATNPQPLIPLVALVRCNVIPFFSSSSTWPIIELY
ncbi:unnamed protein product [Chrysodeixis includens]|uniref:Uncharacterized protein n=1 Tax=Chrysodeixis includens TaxID=689277 RepID=A0A9N8PYP1_CHRIL|nr:unnamed protein product [Chrysodeixis includens]